VVAEVTNIEPNPPHFLPVPLRVMHGNAQGGQFQASFDLAPDQTRCVDVVAISDMQLGPQVQLKHAITGAPENVLGPGSQLTVTVRGHGCPPATRVLGIVNVGGVFALM
jgi:hypothetical protein